MLSQTDLQGAEAQVGQPSLELVPMWDSVTSGDWLTVPQRLPNPRPL